MNHSIDTDKILELTSEPDLIQRLLTLLDHIQVDQATGDVQIHNGAASVTLQNDGTVRVSGSRIVQDAEREIAMTAAWIDLN